MAAAERGEVMTLGARAACALKRTTDVVVAAVALLILLPLLVAVALVVVVDSRGPMFYRAERVGHRGRPLRMLKFRKMHRDVGGAALTVRGDARLTRVGRVLARTRIDELPQLWHVLRGEMSLIGPRPEDPRFVALHPAEYERILRVRPGLTGWTQVAFADEATILRADDPLEHYTEVILPQKVALDGMYAAQPTLGRDLAILGATLLTVVLRRPIAVNRATGAMTLRRRPVAGFATAKIPEIVDEVVGPVQDALDGAAGIVVAAGDRPRGAA